ncbi:GNAT family N-acetyltransferase [Stenotrophomonas sp. NPDC077659]|uniref:GNAT family N-acetyltransferase n=1 Tax=Stenotrophomonas sp. NPDC077659 TaxID=3390694 RepID=UPI003D069A4B
MRITTLQGPAATPYLDDLARLRIRVFRDFPYLYEGDLAYERDYVSTYAAASGSIIVLAQDGDRVVGASTGIPMREETTEFQAPFLGGDWDPQQIFYFGESVLLPEYRGQGAGVRFFDAREAHARQAGFSLCCFSAVLRPLDHPLRPAGYQPLDAFWHNRGYVHHPELSTTFTWRDVGQHEKSAKPMSFWLKELPA